MDDEISLLKRVSSVNMNKKVTLACVDCGSRNYTTTSNKETQTERLELKKYCSNCGAHTVHKETR